MVSVSRETSEQTNERLLDVVTKSRLEVLPGVYAFVDCSAQAAGGAFDREALALVRDGGTWSQLILSDDPNTELFRVFSFHFPDDLDNSGFVGWLATRLKTDFGTGVFVVCGYSRDDGGVFDYWGVPLALGDEVIEAVRALVSGG